MSIQLTIIDASIEISSCFRM